MLLPPEFLEDTADAFDAFEEQRVSHYRSAAGDLIVDTVTVYGGIKPFETAVSHPEYNPGRWAIVETYDTIEQALSGHAKWVSTMTTEPLPEVLKDCPNDELAQAVHAKFGIVPRQMEFRRKQR